MRAYCGTRRARSRADDVVSAPRGRRRRRLRPRRGSAPARGGRRGEGGLARRLPGLRHRVRRRHRGEPQRRTLRERRCFRRSSPRTRALRGAPRGTPTSSMRTGCPRGFPALATGKPLVLQAWGTDVELAVRTPALFRPLVRRARVVVAPSLALAEAVTRLGATGVRVIGSGVDLPDSLAEPAEPPHVLYVGRLAAEKGVEELVEATGGIARVVVGDGPLRHLVPDAVGFVPPAELGDVLRPRCDRRLPVPAGGVWRRRPRGDGARPPRRRISRRRPCWTRSSTSARACSSRLATQER